MKVKKRITLINWIFYVNLVVQETETLAMQLYSPITQHVDILTKDLPGDRSDLKILIILVMIGLMIATAFIFG